MTYHGILEQLIIKVIKQVRCITTLLPLSCMFWPCWIVIGLPTTNVKSIFCVRAHQNM